MYPLRRCFLLVMILGTAGIFNGCGASATGGGRNEPVALSSSDLAQAERLFSQLKGKHAVHRDRDVVEIAGNLVDYYPAFSGNAEALFLAIESAQRTSDAEAVERLTSTLLTSYPESPFGDRVLLASAETAQAAGDTLSAVGYLITYADRHPDPDQRDNPLGQANKLLPTLSAADFGQLMDEHPHSSHWAYLGYLRVAALVESGLAYPESAYPETADVLAEMQARAPADDWTVAAAELLATESAGGRRQIVVAEVNPLRVGVLAPLTGRYAVLGNAFYDAALLATTETNLDLGTNFELVLEDTAADPVTSVLAVRKLSLELGSIAILGGLLSAPTASAAAVCDFYNVPLLSPTATNAGIWKIGPSIFQTNITGLYEVRLLAELGTSIMLKKRFAILHPDSPDGHRHAQVFTAEVESRGGQVVAVEMFPTQGTDYKDQILSIREARPEVIFIPATVDQMVQLGPQLDFYKSGSLIMGLSNWNSRKLRERSATVLERAIFPDDLVMFDRHWESEFNRLWNRDIYPPEATAQALKAYQATRMLLVTLAESAAENRAALSGALARRMSRQDVEIAGPEAYASSVRMFRDEKIAPFPAGLFSAGWQLNEGLMDPAAADSLKAEAADDEWGGLNDQN